jgi:hypothetical protein
MVFIDCSVNEVRAFKIKFSLFALGQGQQWQEPVYLFRVRKELSQRIPRQRIGVNRPPGGLRTVFKKREMMQLRRQQSNAFTSRRS